jgi:predicted N-acetyltransferase YhbS
LETQYSTCQAHELPGLIEKLDAEFVFGRSRSVSLAQRFPNLFENANLEQLFVARERGGIVASVAVKHFAWSDGAEEYIGAMIGMVWTDPARRGSGLATLLLEYVLQALRERADFAVLWTAQPYFYVRLGWAASDNASFGIIAGALAAQPASGNKVDFAAVEPRWRQQTRRVVRATNWQPPLPLPAVALEIFNAGTAYAMAGRLGDVLFCYEILGEPAEVTRLLAQMRAGCDTLYFNEATDTAAYRTLAKLGVSWESRPLAMWLPLRREAPAGRGWYVPWLDRI